MFILDCSLPEGVPETIGAVYNILLVAIPVIVVIFGLIDFLKSASAGKDDEIKSNNQRFVKRLIIGIVAFLVLALVKFGLGLVKTSGTGDAKSCLELIFK